MTVVADKPARNPFHKSALFSAFVDGKSVDASSVSDEARAELAQLEPVAHEIGKAKRDPSAQRTPQRWYDTEEDYLAECPLAVTKRDLTITPREVLESGETYFPPLVRIGGHVGLPGNERKVYIPAVSELIKAGRICYFCSILQKPGTTAPVCDPVDHPLTGEATDSCGCPRGVQLEIGRGNRLLHVA